jgi:hypothetical protein
VSVYQSIIFLILAVIIFALIFSKVYKGKNKVDKGFEVVYFKLSYRRKMIRTLTSSPILIIALIVIYYYSNWTFEVRITLVLFVLLAMCIQLIYNYKMWKKEEGSKI